MLESMRSSAQSWLAKLILGGIAFSFALWGVGDYFNGSRVETVAEVDGSPIVDSQFASAYDRQVNAYRNMLGKQFTRDMLKQFHVKDDTLQTLINRKIMLDEANRLGLTAPEAILVARVQGTPAFRSEAGFDPARYRILTHNMGYASPRDFENAERLNLMVDALQQAIMRSATVSDSEIRARFNREYEQRTLEAIVVDPDTLRASIKIDDADARSYYQAHSDSFKSPRRVGLVAVVIDPKKLLQNQSVDETDLINRYNERKAQFITAEQRQASHILIKVAKDASPTLVDAARKKIEAAKARLDKGEDFAAVAKDISTDNSADKGGDLGMFERGMMVPAFEKAAFALNKGETSAIVRSSFGFHIIKLTAITPAHTQPFEQVKKQLLHELKLAKAGEEAYQLSQDLDDALGQEGTLPAAANITNLPLEEIAPISREEAFGNKLLASSPELLKRAFTISKDDPIEVIELNDGRFVAMAVTKQIAPAVEPFEAVAAKVRNALIATRSEEKAKTLADKILQAASSDSDIDKLAQKFGMPKFISKPVRSNGLGDQSDWLNGKVLAQGFKLSNGSWVQAPIATAKGYAVVRLASVKGADESKFDEQKKEIRKELIKSKGAVRFARWMASARNRHEINLYPKVLERF
ncbi:MAG: SurA N-terminal domain-containing protein [Mariprofundales bacterium]